MGQFNLELELKIKAIQTALAKAKKELV